MQAIKSLKTYGVAVSVGLDFVGGADGPEERSLTGTSNQRIDARD